NTIIKHIDPKTKRVTMYVSNDEQKPVMAAGAIFYKRSGKNMMLLLIEKNCNYEDIGVKIDETDDDINSDAALEIKEETNEIIKSVGIVDRLRKTSYIYVGASKYFVHLVEANENEKVLTKEDFGDNETHCDISRTIGWVSREDLANPAIFRHKLNWRLRSKS